MAQVLAVAARLLLFGGIWWLIKLETGPWAAIIIMFVPFGALLLFSAVVGGRDALDKFRSRARRNKLWGAADPWREYEPRTHDTKE